MVAAAAIAALAAVSVAPAERQDDTVVADPDTDPPSLETSTHLAGMDSGLGFTFNISPAFKADAGSVVDVGATLVPSDVGMSLIDGSAGGGRAAQTSAASLDLGDLGAATSLAWTADVFLFGGDAINGGGGGGGSGTASASSAGAVGGASFSSSGGGFSGGNGADADDAESLLQQLGDSSDGDGDSLLQLAGLSDGEHLGSFSGEIDLTDATQPVLLVIISLEPGPTGDVGGEGAGGDFTPNLVPTPAAVGPGLALLATLLLRRRRHGPSA